jgi:hypothetical protein
MRNRVFSRVRLLVSMIFATAALIVPAGATAATVVNGDFEAGSLTGWQVHNQPSELTGNWFAYTGTAPPTGLGPDVPPPPAGRFAAITAQGDPGTHVLYQDVTLEPYYTHSLSMLLYYQSGPGLTTPSPDRLSSELPANQQYRVDVMNPTAPLESLNPADILATVFATKTGDPQQMGATAFQVNLTPFAGRTVRLRFAEVDNQGILNAGVDSVAILSTPPSNVVALGKPALNKKKGTAKLPVTVPGPGTLTIVDVKLTGKRIKGKTVQAIGPGTVNLPVKPTRPARNALAKRGKQKVKVAITFTPTGGFIASVTRKLILRLAPR